MFEALTAFIPKLKEGGFGEWVVDIQNDGSPEHPIRFPFIDYGKAVTDFMEAVYRFIDTHPAMELRSYSEILEEAGLKWNYAAMSKADVTDMDGRTVMALILGAIRADRFVDGTLLSFLKKGHIVKWLLRLERIDEGAKDSEQ
ncbi:MAG: DUF6508 domain-containing protein [Clostridiales bacterium]|nr:DUF6508 domain-containing protein [Clostridiales bacterium]